jgi:pimeloyl-ACP methyl ester carboxylesterase
METKMVGKILSAVLALVASGVFAAETVPLTKETFKVGEDTAFVINAQNPAEGKPWVWFAPTLNSMPGRGHEWYFSRMEAQGISIAGLNQGEVRGAPGSTEKFTAFYNEMVRRGFSARPVLVGQSRGGLMMLCWAMRNPGKVTAFAGIYPVCNLSSWPLKNSKDAVLKDYGMPEAELVANLKQYNPVDNLQGLLDNKVPIFIVHGNVDTLVPYDLNGRILKDRYEAAGGKITVKIIDGEGHKVSPSFFECQELVDFVLEQVKEKEKK